MHGSKPIPSPTDHTFSITGLMQKLPSMNRFMVNMPMTPLFPLARKELSTVLFPLNKVSQRSFR